MNGVLLSARCLLAAVFFVAAAGKLLDLAGARRALEEFGVPQQLARVGGPSLPVAELTVAVALVLRPSAVFGAAGALVLLLVFIAGVARAMSRGIAPDCHCFGQLHSEPAGPSTLVRNGLLAAPAILVIVAGGGPSLAAALSGLGAVQIALVAMSIVAALLALAVAQMWADTRRLRLELTVVAGRPSGLPRGTPAPEFALATVRGTDGSLGELLTPERPLVMVFLSTSCGPCLALLPTLAGWQASLAESVSLPAVFVGERDEVERLSDEHGLTLALAQEGMETFEAYALRATPSGVLIDEAGVIASAPAEGVPAIEALIRAAAARARPTALIVHQG